MEPCLARRHRNSLREKKKNVANNVLSQEWDYVTGLAGLAKRPLRTGAHNFYWADEKGVWQRLEEVNSGEPYTVKPPAASSEHTQWVYNNSLFT